jgi:hypothetical protein
MTWPEDAQPIHFAYTEHDVVAARSLATQRRRSRYAVGDLLAVAIGLCLVAMGVPAGALIAGGGLVVFGLSRTQLLELRRVRRSLPAPEQRTSTIRLNDAGFHVDGFRGARFVPWSLIDDVMTNAKVVNLMSRGRLETWIPAHVFPDQGAELRFVEAALARIARAEANPTATQEAGG